MDQNPLSMPTNNEPSTTMVIPSVKNSTKYFFFAIAVIILASVLLIAVFVIAFPKTSDQDSSNTSVSTEINSVKGLDTASKELDQIDLDSFENDLQANDIEASSF
jgi:hypothetical protein